MTIPSYIFLEVLPLKIIVINYYNIIFRKYAIDVYILSKWHI